MTNISCFRFHSLKNWPARRCVWDDICTAKTDELFSAIGSTKTSILKQLTVSFMVSIRPVFVNLSFTAIIPCVDIHKVLKLEPINCLPVGIPRLLKIGLRELVGDEAKEIQGYSWIKVAKNIHYEKKYLWFEGYSFCIQTWNYVHRECGIVLDAEISKNDQSRRRDVFPDDIGVVRMLESLYYGTVHILLPFPGGTSDSVCRIESEPIKNVSRKIWIPLKRRLKRRNCGGSMNVSNCQWMYKDIWTEYIHAPV